MLPTGSKLLFGAAAAATFGALLYGIIEGGALGTVGLTFAAGVLYFLGAISLAVRDANVSSMDVEALHRTEAAAAVPPGSMWPAVAGLAGVLLVVGLVSHQIVFVLGIAALVAVGAEWAVQAWSERASADADVNTAVRGRIAHPLEFPVLAAVGVGVIVYSFSRIMLFLSKTGGPVAFGLIAILVLIVGFIVAFRPTLKAGALAGVAVIGAFGLVAGGIASAIGGEREMELHETTAMLAEHNECDTAEETHADDRASQTVGAKSNVTGEVTLHGDGTLTAISLGLPTPADSIVITRNNATNVLFHNDSDEARRLVLNAGTRAEVPDDPASERVPAEYCTALVDEGGTQLLTFTIANTSDAVEEPMTFTVPGVETATVEVVVP